MNNWPPTSSADPAPVIAPPFPPVAEPPPASDAQPIAMPTARRQRMWPVLLALYFLTPVLAELLSGSTPPLKFIQPFGLIFVPLLYGSSALLIRELLARRRLGWANALVLGAAFGVFQEALIVQTWYNFMAKSSPSHANPLVGVWLGTSWVWALNLTVYHAVISITLPLILLTLLFPERALAPGLKRRGLILTLLWLIIPCGLLAIAVATKQYAAEGYHGPPLAGYLLACALTIALTLIGTFAHIPPLRPNFSKRAPGVWAVRFTMFALTAVFFILSFALPTTGLAAPFLLAISAAIFSFGLWRVATWSARAGWSARHWLALVIGLQWWDLLLWAPFVEFGARLPNEQGLTVANIIAAVALFVFDWRLKRRAAAPPLAPALAA